MKRCLRLLGRSPIALSKCNDGRDSSFRLRQKAHIVRLHVLTTTVELESTLESNSLLGSASLGVSLLGGVQSVNIGLMVLLVVKLHDLAGDVGLESIVGVRKVGESVARHVSVVDGGERIGMRELVGRNWGYLSCESGLG